MRDVLAHVPKHAQGLIAALARTIFAQPDARARLNAILHPAIRRHMRAQIDAARADAASGPERKVNL